MRKMGSTRNNGMYRPLLATRLERIGAICLIVALAVVSQFLNEYLLALITQITIFALAGMGLNLLMGNTGLISIAHAAFMGVGAYVSALLTSKAAHLPFLPALLLGGVAAALAAVLLGFPVCWFFLHH